MKKENSERLYTIARILSTLEPIDSFVNKNRHLSYMEFDYLLTKSLPLFSINLCVDFKMLEERIERIRLNIPSIKRVFAKPIIELKDESSVMPVENVRIVSQNSLSYLSTHTNDASSIKNGKVKPKRLLTRIYEDNYSIYENVIACNFLDDALFYIRNQILNLQEIVYTKDVTQINLLERINHINYFLALGKLQTGYVKNFSHYYISAYKNLDMLLELYPLLKARQSTKLYRNNLKRNRHLPLKKTNIFLMQKDYRAIYRLYKELLKDESHTKLEASYDINKTLDSYLEYVKLLCIFSIGHLGFETKDSKMDLINTDVCFDYLDWKIELYNRNGLLYIDTIKDKMYRVVICPSLFDNYRKCEESVDEVILSSPIEDECLGGDKLFISVENIDSFRRIQQILIRAMIASDNVHKVCPFCGEKLYYNSKANRLECYNCKMEIYKAVCTNTGKEYYYTSIAGFKAKSTNTSRGKASWLYHRKLEGLLHFRNITRIDEKGRAICPYCNEIHM